MNANLDLTAKYGSTTFSNYEIQMIGEALVSWIGVTTRLGHSSPASVIDYTGAPGALGLGGLIVRDFVAWTSGRTADVEGCEERMRELVANSNLDAELASRAFASP